MTTDYGTLLEHGRVASWRLINTTPKEPEAWWAALERLASSDGLRVKRGWENYGGGELVNRAMSTG